jgi:pilus assembly protein CpaC
MSLARSYVGKAAINMMTVGGTQQVMLKVRVAEMSRSAAKELGINTVLGGTGKDIGGAIISGPGTKPNPTFGIGIDPPTSFSAGNAFGSLGFLAQIGDIGIGIALTALEQKGFSRTQTDVEFKEVGVALNFTPTVLDDDLINLELSTEVSAIDTTLAGVPISANGGDIPIFNVRRATTVIELRDGQSFAIAGLLEDNFTDSIQQFPWAHLVVPVSEEELSLPHDHVRIPNEFELFLMGHTDGAGAPGMVQSQGFDGAFGYLVE